MKELCKELLLDGWDDDLHAKICHMRLKMSDSFPKWVNNICHLNIILQGTDYHFSNTALCLHLESLLDLDLCRQCKSCQIKETVEAVSGSSEDQIKEVCLSCCIVVHGIIESIGSSHGTFNSWASHQIHNVSLHVVHIRFSASIWD